MSLSLKTALDHRNKRGLRSEETTALESHRTHQGTASWVISSHAEELRVLHHWAFLPLELDSVDPTDAPGLDPPSSRHSSDGHWEAHGNHWHRDTPGSRRWHEAEEETQELAGRGGGVRFFKLFIYFLLPVSSEGCAWSACAQPAGCWSPASWSCSSSGTRWPPPPYRRSRRPLCSKWLSPDTLGKLWSPFLLLELDCRSHERNR